MPVATPKVERIAHRGASKEHLENTLPAFKTALDRSADGIELDVHRTRDGVVVVHHDEQAAGVTISNADWGEIAAIRLLGGARIPRLEDVLTTVANEATVYIELKGRDVEAATLDIARRCGQRYAVHSFDHAAVERARTLAPEVPRGVLLDRGTRDPIAAMQAACARVAPRDVWPHFSLVDGAFMKAAATLSVRVIVWTVNSPSEARRLADLGAAGLCTDDVRILANP